MRTWCLIFLFSLASIYLRANGCCEFPLRYIMATQQAPSDQVLNECLLNTECDKRYVFAGKMINAFEHNEPDAVDRYFDNFLDLSSEFPIDDTLNLKVVYIYASYLELQGLSNYALTYYQFINNNGSHVPALRLLGAVGTAGINKSTEFFETYEDTINQKFNTHKIAADDKIAIVSRYRYYLQPRSTYDIISKYKNLYENSIIPTSKFFFLSTIEFYSLQKSGKEYNSIWNAFKKSYSEVDQGKYRHLWETILARKALSENEYDASLAHARKALEIKIGEFEDHAALLSRIKNLDVSLNEYVERYAQNKLYQTRLGKGLDPVKEAFQLYLTVFSNKLRKELNSASSVYSDNSTHVISIYSNLLIVGTYLYQQTGDITYLNESISIMDGFAGAGSNYWTRVRDLMRRDAGFAGALRREQELLASLREPGPELSLRELRQRHLALEAHRLNLRQDYPELYEGLANDYSLDLPEIREELRADSSGVVAFYLNDDILYRLFIAGDSIEILPMNNVRREALELTGTLSALIANGKSANLVREPSRRLYQLLFGGLDGRLPERLHLIASGELDEVPFAALRRDTAAGPPRYLGLEVALSRQFSIRSMKMLEKTTLHPRYAQPLGMAPSFSNNLLQASELRQAGFKLPPLLYNGEELRQLEARSAGKYLYDEAATLPAYKSNATDYGILHLATHAISSQADGLRSRVYLLDEAGEPTSLYASDIGDQTLNANLVVLSACETGAGGRHANEGRIGLTKAYLAAGARSVVASTWAVDDRATAELMQVFYQALEAGAPPHEALRTSRQAYLEKFPEAAPYKWAAFAAYGGMTPVPWERNGSNNYLYALAGVLLLGTVGYFSYQKISAK